LRDLDESADWPAFSRLGLVPDFSVSQSRRFFGGLLEARDKGGGTPALEEQGMEVHVYGKQDCGRCESTKKKIAFFLDKWSLGEQVKMVFVDMDTVDGRAEGAFNDVYSVPTTILRRQDSTIARWEGEVPSSEALRQHLQAQ